ncbi:hypothetical protein ABBQ32_000919 [Trebouxia sp. C0010 RCD-2024]
MTSVTPAESAALVLRYLETTAFLRTAGTFRREARKLLKTIVAPPTVKPLAGILDEYVELKEADRRRKQLVQSNPVVGDLLAVIENHAAKSPDQPSQAHKPTACLSAEQQAPEPELLANDQPGEMEMLACEPSFGETAGMTADYQHATEATPAQQQADLPATHLASPFSKLQSSSQHSRKSAPRRWTDQSDRVLSPISRPALSSLGGTSRGAAGIQWMNLPMTEDGFSSLMHDDSFQQRFAEGLAMHLTSGPEVDNGADKHYDAVLASLPADPAMAGLLEPLVLPPEAYHIPAETQKLLAAHRMDDQQAGLNQLQHPPPVHQTASDTIMAVTASAVPCSADAGAALPVQGSASSAQFSEASVREQQHYAGQANRLVGLVGLQSETLDCHPLLHGQRVDSEQLEQQHPMTASMQLQTEAAQPTSQPEQQPTSILSVPAVPCQSGAQAQAGTIACAQAHEQDEQGAASLLSGEQANHAPDQLQGLPLASAWKPAPDQLPPEHGTQQSVLHERNLDAAQQAALDNLYATIFPDRHISRASTDGPEQIRRFEGSTADATAAVSRRPDNQPAPTATNLAGPSSRKRQRSSSNPNATAQPVDSALPHRQRQVLTGNSAGPQQGRLACGQQQLQQQQHCFIDAATPACRQAHDGASGMTCGSKHAGHASSAVPADVCNAVRTSAAAAELGSADANQPKQQLQRPVLASLPSNQLSSVDAAGTVLLQHLLMTS